MRRFEQMNSITAFFYTTGEILQLLMESFFWCKVALRNREKIFRQMLEIGNQTLPVAALISLFIGGVLALQSGPPLSPFGIEENIGGVVGVSFVKKLGPGMAFLP